MNKKNKQLLQNGILNDLGINTPNNNKSEHLTRRNTNAKPMHAKSHNRTVNKWKQFKKMLKK